MSEAPVRKVVLIVEDDPDTLSIYREVLAERGYAVLTARQGAEGVHLARRHRPDLILMDTRMPVMDGWHAAWYIKTDPQTAKIPICRVSAYVGEEEARAQPDGASFDRTLPKPAEPGRVVAAVEAMIGSPVRDPSR